MNADDRISENCSPWLVRADGHCDASSPRGPITCGYNRGLRKKSGPCRGQHLNSRVFAR